MQSKVKYILSSLTKMKLQIKMKQNKQIFSFYQSLFSRQVQVQTDKIDAYLDNIPLPKLTKEQTLSCEGIISEDEMFIIIL